MCARKNIVEEILEKIARAAQQNQRGVILQPGAIGDCILTLPLAEFMKETVCRGGVDLIGRTEYIGILPRRSCVDAVSSMDSMGLHRLFAKEEAFEVADGDPLIMAFAEYAWIATFLGEPDSNFEKNLIFTVNCSHSAEVMTLAMKPAAGNNHISDFYRSQFIEQSGFDELATSGLSAAEYPSTAFRTPVHDLQGQAGKTAVGMPLLKPTAADMTRGKEILAEFAPAASLLPASASLDASRGGRRSKTAGATRKPVVIHPGSGGTHKCWHLDNFLSVAGMLAREDVEVVFLLGPAELERFAGTAISSIEAAGKLLTNLPLADVLAVLGCARGYVGNDSGITHLAAALGIRTVAVFGPTDPVVYGPVGPAVTILHSDTPDFAGTVSEDLQQQICEILLA